MTYEIRVGKRTRKEIARFRTKDQVRIVVALRALAEDPRPAGCRPVTTAERGTYRVRVGDHRIAYLVLDNEQVVIVARVSRRGEDTYKGL